MTSAAQAAAIVTQLAEYVSEAGKQKMQRFGIATTHALGGPTMPVLRRMAKAIGQDTALAQALWHTAVHEARILATLVAHPQQLTLADIQSWLRDLDSWDVCDACCSLWARTPWAWQAVAQWHTRDAEYERRAAYSLLAMLAVHDKQASDVLFVDALPLIEAGAADNRNFVKKAVNWALRQIGKRNPALNQAAITCAQRIAKQGAASARWIASDTLRELRSEQTMRILQKRVTAKSKLNKPTKKRR